MWFKWPFMNFVVPNSITLKPKETFIPITQPIYSIFVVIIVIFCMPFYIPMQWLVFFAVILASLQLQPRVILFLLSNIIRFEYLRLHSCDREGSCCWFSGCHSPPPLMNRLVRDPESGRPAPIMPGTVSRRAVGPAGGLSWLQISGVINTIAIKYPW